MKDLLVTVRILKDAHLPRFTFKQGDLWEVRASKLTEQGFPVGGGFITSDYYKIHKDES